MPAVTAQLFVLLLGASNALHLAIKPISALRPALSAQFTPLLSSSDSKSLSHCMGGFQCVASRRRCTVMSASRGGDTAGGVTREAFIAGSAAMIVAAGAPGTVSLR